MTKKIAVIVGAGPGVSMAAAKKFGTNGYTIALMARREESLNQYVNELMQLGIEAKGFQADAAEEESLKNAFQHVKSEMGSPEVMIYNAAIMRNANPSELSADLLINDFKVNTVGALVSAQQVIPDMKANQEGTILFTGGGLALHPAAAYSSLAIGKSGIRSLAYSLGEELESAGVFVGTVTIAGFVQPNTFFDPENIADVFYQLHLEKGQREVVFKQ